MKAFVTLLCLLGLWVSLTQEAVSVRDSGYDPLKRERSATPEPIDLTVQDTVRQREIPLRVYLPVGKSVAPVSLFSHGLGGSRAGNAFMGKHWAARGYVAIFVQHPGSDTSVWQDKPLANRMGAMREAASLQNFMLRVKDIPVVLDQLERWNKVTGNPLMGRMDMSHIGMSGHSFGAVTTQAVSGERYPGAGRSLTDGRIKAAIAFSPSGPRRAGGAAVAFGSVAIPWMLMTGTKDTSPIGNTYVASRLSVYPALPPGDKYELVLDRAEHSAFTDRALPGDREPRNPNHHRAILALSTAFWDAYLKGDRSAKDWLTGDGPQTILESADRWQKK